MTLWFIKYDDDNGENLDLFVEAENRDAAISAWDHYYGDMQLPATVQVMNLSNAARDANGVLVWDFVESYQ
jgi:hypothetical protein